MKTAIEQWTRYDDLTMDYVKLPDPMTADGMIVSWIKSVVEFWASDVPGYLGRKIKPSVDDKPKCGYCDGAKLIAHNDHMIECPYCAPQRQPSVNGVENNE